LTEARADAFIFVVEAARLQDVPEEARKLADSGGRVPLERVSGASAVTLALERACE
jgi:hypothetical protein